MFAARERIRFDADEAEQPADEPVDLIADDFGVVCCRRWLERTDDVDSDTGGRTGGVDRELHALTERGDVAGAEPPCAKTLCPGLGLGSGKVGDAQTGLLRVAFVDPRLEVGRGEVREGETEVGEIALRVDQQGRHSRSESILDEHDAEARLARAGHAHDHTVGRQVP